MTHRTYNIIDTLFQRLQSFQEDFLYFYSLDIYLNQPRAYSELVQVELIYETVDGQQNDLLSMDEDSCKHLIKEFELTGYSLIVVKAPKLQQIHQSYNRIKTVNELLLSL